MSSDSETSSKSAGSNKQSPGHYNDWPNAQGFDVRYEEHQPIQLKVSGHIPSYAAGVFFRTSVGPRDVYGESPKRLLSRTNHWFDSISQVHRFQIHLPQSESGNVKVTYNSRVTADGLIERIEKGGKGATFTFGAKYDPCKSVFSKAASFFTPEVPINKPNEVINAVTLSVNYPGLTADGSPLQGAHQAGEMMTLCNKTDVSRLQMLDPNTLEPIGIAHQTVLHPSLKGLLSGAHAKSDPKTGDVYNFNLDIAGPNSMYRVFKTSASTGKTSVLASIKHAPAYLHSTFISENYIILCIWNSYFKTGGISILYNKNLVEAMYTNKDVPAAWYVIDKRDPETEGGKGCVALYESDPFFAFHTTNAYEERNQENSDQIDIVADIPVWDSMEIINYFLLDNMMSNSQAAHDLGNKRGASKPVLRRYRLTNVPQIANNNNSSTQTKSKKPQSGLKTLNLSTIPRQRAKVDFTMTEADSVELPTLNFNMVTKPHRYVYGVMFGSGDKSTFADGLIKIDLSDRSRIVWEKKGHTPGEAIFVPDPKGTKEDDGVLLTVVLDGYNDHSYLLILDARDMSEIGRADVPGVVGFGFHGVFTKLRAKQDAVNGDSAGLGLKMPATTVSELHY